MVLSDILRIFVLQSLRKMPFWAALSFGAAVPRLATGKKSQGGNNVLLYCCGLRGGKCFLDRSTVSGHWEKKSLLCHIVSAVSSSYNASMDLTDQLEPEGLLLPHTPPVSGAVLWGGPARNTGGGLNIWLPPENSGEPRLCSV